MDNRKRSLDSHNRPKPSKNLQKTSARSFLSDSPSEKSSRRPKSRQSKSSRSHFRNDSDSEEVIDKTTNLAEYGRRGSTYSERSYKDFAHSFDNKDASEAIGQAQKRRRQQRRRGEAKSLQEARDSDEEDLDQDRDTLKSAKVKTDSSASAGSRRRKKRKPKAREEPRDELPITEILRKSQETARIQYEESAPLPQLTTDTIYVQGRNGFSAIKISGDRGGQSRRDSGPRGTHPIKVAILAQKAWRSGGLIYQGLLAGMALMHFIFMLTLANLFEDNVVDGSIVSEIYASLFSFLVAMSVVSAFDKFDLAHLDWDHFKEIYLNHAKPFLAIPLYITVFFLHQATSKFDDNLALVHYQAKNETFFNEGNNTTKFTNDDLSTWKTLILIKDGLAVLAWLFIALGPQNDMLLVHLKALQKYAYDLDGI